MCFGSRKLEPKPKSLYHVDGDSRKKKADFVENNQRLKEKQRSSHASPDSLKGNSKKNQPKPHLVGYITSSASSEDVISFKKHPDLKKVSSTESVVNDTSAIIKPKDQRKVVSKAIQFPDSMALGDSEKKSQHLTGWNYLNDNTDSGKILSQKIPDPPIKEKSKKSKSELSESEIIEPPRKSKKKKAKISDSTKIVPKLSTNDLLKISSKSSDSSEENVIDKYKKNRTDILQPIYFIIMPTNSKTNESSCKNLLKICSKNTTFPKRQHGNMKKCGSVVICQDSCSNSKSSSSEICQCSDSSVNLDYFC